MTLKCLCLYDGVIVVDYQIGSYEGAPDQWVHVPTTLLPNTVAHIYINTNIDIIDIYGRYTRSGAHLIEIAVMQ